MPLSKPQTMALWNLSDRTRGVDLLSQDTSGHIIAEVQHSVAGRGLKRYKLPHEGGIEDITAKPAVEPTAHCPKGCDLVFGAECEHGFKLVAAGPSDE